MRVWITKHALERPIFTTEASLCSSRCDALIVSDKTNTYYVGDEWHMTEAEAIAKAKIMRSEFLKKMTFTLKEN